MNEVFSNDYLIAPEVTAAMLVGKNNSEKVFSEFDSIYYYAKLKDGAY